MKSKGFLTACLLLLALSAAVWWSNKKAATAEKSAIETSTKLINIPGDQFQEIEIKHRTGETVRLQRNDLKWQITSPKPLPADADAVSSMVSALSSLSSDRAVDEKPTGLDQYGLDDFEPDEDSDPEKEYLPQEPLTNPFRHVGRNDPCPCGSGKKFKRCCLGKAA